jgi:hypothetical protein
MRCAIDEPLILMRSAADGNLDAIFLHRVLFDGLYYEIDLDAAWADNAERRSQLNSEPVSLVYPRSSLRGGR